MRYKLFSKGKGKSTFSLHKEINKLKSQVNELEGYKEYFNLLENLGEYYSIEYNFKTNTFQIPEKLFSRLGYKQTEIHHTSEYLSKLVHRDDLETITTNFLADLKLQSSNCYNKTFRLLSSSKKFIWVKGSSKITEWDNRQNPLKLKGLIQIPSGEKQDQLLFEDSQKQIRNELQAKDEHLKDLARILPEVVFETDEKGNITFVNEKAYEIFEFTQKDFTNGINLFKYIANKDKERVKENFYKTARKDNVKGNEYTVLSKEGKEIPVLVYSTPIFKGNCFAGTRGIIVTIGELKKSREKLRKSEENFRQLADNIQDGFWLIDMNNQLIYANRSCELIVEKTIEGPFQFPDIFFNYIHPEDKSKILKEIKYFQQNPLLKHSYEHRIITNSGNIKWISVRVFPVLNKNGKLYRKAGIVSDITQKKHLIQELIKAKDKAEEADKLKSSFLANMSHEIRTPMNGILGFAELLKDPHTTPSEKMEYINIIQNNGKHLLNLINDIIDFAKIEAGELNIIKKPFDIKLFITNIYKTYKNQYKHRLNSIDFSYKMKPMDANPMLYSDAFRIEQVLINFLTNAFKFTTKGKIEIGYELNHKIEKNEYIKFFVRDTGIGINTKDQNTIFERFGQAKSYTQLKPKGTGLGLAISRNIAELLGGKIGVKSQINKGSTFYFYIPYERGALDIEDISSDKEEADEFTMANMTLLIVEDDPTNMEYLKKLLLLKKVNVLTASTGEKAVELVKHYHSSIDLILMDIRLPGMDGYDTTLKIKAINNSIPVIAQTAYALDGDKKKSIEMGCDDHINKPIQKTVLFEKLNHYLYTYKKE
jgi:PAS domain S-box-containing protein